MKSRIIIIIFLMLFSMFYTELRIIDVLEINTDIMELVSLVNKSDITQNKRIKTLAENEHAILCLLKDPYNLSEECKGE